MSEPTMFRTCGSTRLRAVFQSAKGGRGHNEDNYLAILPGAEGGRAHYLDGEEPRDRLLAGWPRKWARFAVADGMGGHAGGREMAQAAVEALMDVPPLATPESMREALLALHETLREQNSMDAERSPGTTLLLVDVELRSKMATLGTVGDNRAYRVRGRQYWKLTHDHTAEEFDWREGDLSEQAYRRGLRRNTNEIAQALGYGSSGLIRERGGYRPNRFHRSIRLDLESDLDADKAGHADVFQFRVGGSTRVVLASDGLWNPDPEGSWSGPLSDEVLSDAEVTAQIDQALAKGSSDNITVLVFGFADDGGA